MSVEPAQRLNKRRTKGLQKLGVSEDDVHLAERLMKQIPACPSDPNKAERIFGYAKSRLERQKAMRLLGATEEEVEVENAKNLGSLGVGARRRSFSVIERAPSKPLYKNRKSSISRKPRHSSFDTALRPYKRKHSAELRRLRQQSMVSAIEIDSLRKRIEELENLIQSSSRNSSCSSVRIDE